LRTGTHARGSDQIAFATDFPSEKEFEFEVLQRGGTVIHEVFPGFSREHNINAFSCFVLGAIFEIYEKNPLKLLLSAK
jgi:hypothetical protein